MLNRFFTHYFKDAFWLNIVVFSIALLFLAAYFFYQYADSQIHPEQAQLIKKREYLLNRSQYDEAIIHGKWMHTLNQRVQATSGDILWDKRSGTGVILLAGLPHTHRGEEYEVVAYDLERSPNEPINIVSFTQERLTQDQRLVELTPESPIGNPFKFTLSLKAKDKKDQILLMAQP